MTIRPIFIAGDPVLHTAARPIEVIDDTIRTLVSDMFETMDAAPGVGLAAPQIGVPLRLFVYGFTDENEKVWKGVAINPVLWVSQPPARPARDEESEGCLSFPRERFPLVRSESAILQATDLDGQQYERKATGWVARIFQHEYDHLDGTLYVDRLSAPHAKIAQKALIKAHGNNVAGQTWLPDASTPENETT